MHTLLKWKYCHSDFPPKPLAAIKPLVPLRLKNLATSHLVLRGKASQMICDHRNFTLGQLEAGCLPANELAPHHKGGTTPRWCCRSQQWLLRGQPRRRGSDLLCHLQSDIGRVGEATEAAETSFVQNQE